MPKVSHKTKVLTEQRDKSIGLTIKAIGLANCLLEYVQHKPCCGHPHERCECGLSELNVKVRRLEL